MSNDDEDEGVCVISNFAPEGHFLEEMSNDDEDEGKLGNEPRKAFLVGKEAGTGTHEVVGIDDSLQSFEDLVVHISSNRQDIKTFVSMAKHMLEACVHPFFDELRDPNTGLLNGRPLPPLLNFKPQELAGIPKDFLERLIHEHARKQHLFMALNT